MTQNLTEDAEPPAGSAHPHATDPARPAGSQDLHATDRARPAGSVRLNAADVELLRDRHLGVLATIKSDGRPQLSTISYAFDVATSTARISTVTSLAKVKNLRRDPRAGLHVSSNSWGWMVAEGTAELSAVAADTSDPVVEELIALYRTIGGEHPDWDDFRRAMVADHRLVVRLRVERTYGTAPR